MHLLLVGISHRTAPVELRERVDFQARGLDGGARALGARGVDARSGRALDLQPRRALRRVRRRRRRRARDLVDVRQRVPRRRPATRSQPHVYELVGSRRRAAPVPRRRRPRLARRRRAADSRPGQGRAHGRRRRARPSGPCSTGCSTRRSPSASACAPKPASASGAVSVSFAAVALARKIFGDLKGRSVARRRRRRDGQADRAAHEVAGRAAASRSSAARWRTRRGRPKRSAAPRAAPWDELDAALGASDIVITATGAAAPILTKAHIEAVMRPRRNRPLFIIDIAMPRDVEAGGRRNRAGVPLQHRRPAGDGAREPRAARQRGRARRGDRRRGSREVRRLAPLARRRSRPSSRCGSASRRSAAPSSSGSTSSCRRCRPRRARASTRSRASSSRSCC